MQSKEPTRNGLYLAYSAEPPVLSAAADALTLLRGNATFTPRERLTVLAEFSRARADAQKLREAARADKSTRASPPPDEDGPA